jgi:hypothetical protein
MLRIDCLKGALLAACAAALLAPPLVAAQDRDAREVASYTLTDAGLAKYTAATKNLAALPGSKPGDCGEGPDSMTLSEMVASLDGMPAVKSAIQSAGMTTREYVLFSWSILHNGLAAWAITQPGGKLPAGTSKANVDFYNKHAGEIEKLGALSKDDECDAETDEEEYVE